MGATAVLPFVCSKMTVKKHRKGNEEGAGGKIGKEKSGLPGGRDCAPAQCNHLDTVLFNILEENHFLPRSSLDMAVCWLLGSCWETRHLVSSFEVHFED